MRAAGEFAADGITLVDLRIPGDGRLEGARVVEGSLSDPRIVAQATGDTPDLVFHLAGLTSRRCEADPAAALEANLYATAALLEALRAQGNCPVLVFTSSIAVFGTPLPARIDDSTREMPTLTYGALKKMVEVLLADYSRRGAIDGLSLRLPSVVARPAQPDASLSAFASDLIREPSMGRATVCPVSADATIWLLSLPACLDNLVHAARILSAQRLDEAAVADDAHPARASLPPTRALTLPALRTSAAQVVDALVRRYGEALRRLVGFESDPARQEQFGCWPPLSTTAADRLGFRHDGDLDSLIDRSLQAG